MIAPNDRSGPTLCFVPAFVSRKKVMHFSFLASKYPEYSTLRARNRSLALVWQFGHAALAMSPFSVFAAVLIVVVDRIYPEVYHERSPWPIVAALVLWAVLCIGLGIGLQRYAIRKGENTTG